MTERDLRAAMTAASVASAFIFCLFPLVPAAETASQVLATVDGEAITIADVDREVAIAFPGRELSVQDRVALRDQTTEQLIRRQLVLRYLSETKQSAGPAEIDLAVERLKKQLALREQPYDDYLRLRQLDEAGLRRGMAWQIGWGRLLAKYLTDSNLQRYFENHRRDFDGTEVRVAHIVFAIPESAAAATRDASRKQAAAVLTQLRANQLPFAEAARRYSSGPSRETGGDIGFISRREPMPESFSLAAFGLEVNQISEPVETTVGFHIIRCLATSPGQKRWVDVRTELESAVTEYLFQWAADRGRPMAKIERLR